jgi:hypothetical protein
MAKVNHISLNQVLKLLDISNSFLIQKLYVSQSLVSRWKNGTRSVNSNSELYKNLIGLITSVNGEHGIHELENFLSEIYPEKKLDETDILKNTLYLYLFNNTTPYLTDNVSRSNGEILFNIYYGLNGRLEALRAFFNKALSIGEKTELYIFDAENYKWCSGPNPWEREFHSLCAKCMDLGIKIYIFSSMYGIKKENFYAGWYFTSHYNLYPGYYSEHYDSTSYYSHYLIKDHMSVIFYSPNGNPKEYYTAVYTDPGTCRIHYEYLKTKYRNASPQLTLGNLNDRSYALNTLSIHSTGTEPVVMIGKIPNFALSSKNCFNDILLQNNLSRDRKQLGTNYFNLLTNNFYKSRTYNLSLLYYLDDLINVSESNNVLDLELTGITGSEIYITNNQVKDRLKNAAEILKINPSVNVCIVPKTYSPIYSVLGEMLTLWCKRNKWYFTVYENLPLEPRLILDNSACELRGEMFNDLFIKIPGELNNREKSIEIFERLSQTP